MNDLMGKALIVFFRSIFFSMLFTKKVFSLSIGLEQKELVKSSSTLRKRTFVARILVHSVASVDHGLEYHVLGLSDCFFFLF